MYAKWWRRHPLAWNEIILIPLPQASRFLALLVRSDREFGFDKIAFVGAQRRTQRQAAKAALIEVALDDLSADSLKKLAELPVVLVTALETREDRERGIDVGANAYLVKSSFDQSNLLEAVRRLA